MRNTWVEVFLPVGRLCGSNCAMYILAPKSMYKQTYISTTISAAHDSSDHLEIMQDISTRCRIFTSVLDELCKTHQFTIHPSEVRSLKHSWSRQFPSRSSSDPDYCSISYRHLVQARLSSRSDWSCVYTYVSLSPLVPNSC